MSTMRLKHPELDSFLFLRLKAALDDLSRGKRRAERHIATNDPQAYARAVGDLDWAIRMAEITLSTSLQCLFVPDGPDFPASEPGLPPVQNSAPEFECAPPADECAEDLG